MIISLYPTALAVLSRNLRPLGAFDDRGAGHPAIRFGVQPKADEDSYSITSSASASSIDGMVRPSAVAVFWLMTSSNRVTICTGKSPGLVPFNILSTYSAI